LPKFERSEQRQRIERPHRMPDLRPAVDLSARRSPSETIGLSAAGAAIWTGTRPLPHRQAAPLGQAGAT